MPRRPLMLLKQNVTYLAAFQKPWYVTLGFLQAAARERQIRIVGFWPKSHPNAPRVSAPNAKPYSHLIAGTMIGPSRDLALPDEVAWVTLVS